MKHHILSIGVSAQQNTSFHRLNFSHKDAIDFFTLFTSNIANIGYKKLLTDNEATLSAIRTSLGDELINQIGPEDTFFFLFSGHGAVDINDSGIATHYLVPFDATDDFDRSCVSVPYIQDVLNSLGCKSSLIFIDSCFSGAVGSKSLPIKKKSSPKEIKSFVHMEPGEGKVIFTACKESETALEDGEKQNSLFTFYLLQELQRQRQEETYPVQDIFNPIATEVSKRAKERWGQTQTPFINYKSAGGVRLPVFQNKLKITPPLIHPPINPELTNIVFNPPIIEIEDKTLEKNINSVIEFVDLCNTDAPKDLIRYEKYTLKLLKQVEAEWQNIFLELGTDLSKISEGVAKIEAAALQLVILGAATAVFGSNKQMKIYGKAVSGIIEWGYGKSGLVAAISIPEILIVILIYVIGVICVEREDLLPFETFLYTEVYDQKDEDYAPQPLFNYFHVHYCDALGGSATKVGDHVRDTLKTYSWLSELAPKISGNTDTFQLQTNYLLSSLLEYKNGRLYPDFGRFYESRLTPLIAKIKHDHHFRQQIARLFRVDEKEIRGVLATQLRKLTKYGLGNGLFWESITENSLYTSKEGEHN